MERYRGDGHLKASKGQTSQTFTGLLLYFWKLTDSQVHNYQWLHQCAEQSPHQTVSCIPGTRLILATVQYRYITGKYTRNL